MELWQLWEGELKKFFLFDMLRYFYCYPRRLNKHLPQIKVNIIFLHDFINSQLFFLIRIQMQRILQATNQQLGIAGTIGATAASIFLAPKKHIVVGPAVIALAVGSFLFAKSRWVQSEPDEWMLVVRDGKLLKAGIGLKTFVGFTDTVVRFRSRLETVYFSARNVTKQMQGVEIDGVAFWSVYRQDDGPFRCYKYMQGNNANESVKVMCESLLRNLIANSTLDDVLRNRKYLREKIKDQLKDHFRGWGIWLQTIEITNVTISSTKLFTDLQAEFRQSAHLKAEQIELMNKEKLTESKQESEIKISTLVESIKTKKQETTNNHMLKRKQLEAEFEQKKNQLELKKMERQKKIQLQKYKNDHEVNEQRVTNTQELDKMRQDFDKEFRKKKFELEKCHDEKTLAKYEIDSLERTYCSLRANTISVSQYTGGDKETIAALLPNLAYGMAQMNH